MTKTNQEPIYIGEPINFSNQIRRKKRFIGESDRSVSNTDDRVALLVGELILDDRDLWITADGGRLNYYLTNSGQTNYRPMTASQLSKRLQDRLNENGEFNSSSLAALANTVDLPMQIETLMDFGRHNPICRPFIKEKRKQVENHISQLRDWTDPLLQEEDIRRENEELNLPQWARLARAGARWLIIQILALNVPHSALKNYYEKYYIMAECPLCYCREQNNGFKLKVEIHGTKYCCVEGGRAWGNHSNEEPKKFLKKLHRFQTDPSQNWMGSYKQYISHYYGRELDDVSEAV
jgi:hypothetical protein